MSLGGAEIGVEELHETGAVDGESPKRKQTIRVVVADDHPIVRYALRQMLNSTDGIEVVGESNVGPEILGIVSGTRADVLILDFRMSDSQIGSILSTLRQIANTTRVIILTASEDKKQFVHALKIGCSGIILKQATAEQIATCIRKVHEGGVWVDARIAAALAEFDSRVSDGNVNPAKRSDNQFTLSEREREVLALVAHGYTNPEIAAKLSISLQTVKNHLHNIYWKTGVGNRAELVIHAIHNGLHIVHTALSRRDPTCGKSEHTTIHAGEDSGEAER